MVPNWKDHSPSKKDPTKRTFAIVRRHIPLSLCPCPMEGGEARPATRYRTVQRTTVTVNVSHSKDQLL